VPLPKYRPQLATLVEQPPIGPQWLHELKFDGYRMGCAIEGGRVRFESRANRTWTGEFGELVAAAQQLPVRSALLDGEVAILLPNGLTSFQALQNAFSGGPRPGLVYFVFDLLHLDGRDMAPLPLEERKRECEKLLRRLPSDSPFRYSQHFEVDGGALLARACELGAEGIISKRRDQAYRAGRGPGWLKSKCTKRATFVVGGFTAPGGTRAGIGAVLLGHYQAGRLRFAGKVGTGPGFTADYLARLRRELDAIAQSECPFDPPPGGWIGRHGRWVRPIRRGQVSFTEWTDAGTLRHPSFQGFEDQEATGARAALPGAPQEGPLAASRRRATGPESAPRPRAGSGARVRPGPPPATSALSSPERLIYPDLHFSKGDLARFYADIAPWLLPYLANRPLTLVRCVRPIRSSNAWRAQCQFLPHDAGSYDWAGPPVRTVRIQEQKKIGEYPIIDSADGLVALVNGGIVELHAWNSTVDHLETPDRIVLDLDPGEGVTWSQTVAAASELRALLASLGLASWPKLTGGKGVHVVVPFLPEHGWAEIYELSHRIAQAAVERVPTTFTTSFAKHQRSRRILLDYKRNHRGAVAVAGYSARARPTGAVGVPVSWRQLAACASPDVWTVANVRPRLRRLKSDPWREFWACRQRLGR